MHCVFQLYNLLPQLSVSVARNNQNHLPGRQDNVIRIQHAKVRFEPGTCLFSFSYLTMIFAKRDRLPINLPQFSVSVARNNQNHLPGRQDNIIRIQHARVSFEPGTCLSWLSGDRCCLFVLRLGLDVGPEPHSLPFA